MRIPGALMAAEMDEQPAVLARLIERREDIVALVRRHLPDPLRGLVLVARGSSDHAAVYGRYVMEYAAGLPVALAAPSLHTLYGARVDYRGYLAVAISQSGRTPEIVTVLEQLKRAGAAGVAVTNETASPLADAADAVIDLEAGEERAVPATKTFTAQLAAFAFLAEALVPAPWEPDAWPLVPEAVAAVLANRAPAEKVAAAVGNSRGLIAVGRGFLFGIALETALKLKETSSILAQGYSAADLRHGPIAVIEQAFPVIAFVLPGPAQRDMEDLGRLLVARGAQLFRVGPGGELPVPSNLPEALAAFPATVRAQQVAHALALHRGLDPDRPEGLTKVTPTA